MGGISAFRSWLNITHEGDARLKVIRGKVPMLEWEIERYHYKRDQKTKQLIEEPERRHNHIMDTCRYLAQYDPEWHKPPKRTGKLRGALAALKQKMERAKQRGEGRDVISLGPKMRI